MSEPVFRSASACANSGCVEVAFNGRSVLVRGTSTPGTLRFTRGEWAAFLAGVRAGEFDEPTAG